MEKRNDDASKKASKAASEKASQEANVDVEVQVDVLNWELWEANKMSAMQKRILVTHVFGEAW
eukprot:15673490-Heterocapsa_arctica.AAC.1